MRILALLQWRGQQEEKVRVGSKDGNGGLASTPSKSRPNRAEESSEERGA